MATTTETKHRVILDEGATPLGIFTGNYTLIWWGLLAVFFIFVILGSAVLGAILVGVGVVIIVTAVTVSMVSFKVFEGGRTTAMALLYRKAERSLFGSLGWLRQTNDVVETGETFGLPNAGVKPPKKTLQIFGKVDFRGYAPGESDRNKMLGIAYDKRYGTMSATMRVLAYPLLSVSAQDGDEWMDNWSRILDGLVATGSYVHRFAWTDRTDLGEDLDPQKLIDEIRTHANLTRTGHPNEEIFARNVAAMGSSSTVHNTTLTVTVLGSAINRQAKLLGGKEAVLVEELETLKAGLNPGPTSPFGVAGAYFLSVGELMLHNREVLDPVFAQPIREQLAKSPENYGLLRQAIAWPEYVDFLESPDCCRVGDTYHIGLYVHNFSRTGITPKQFARIVTLRVPKTISVVFEMVSEHRARKQAERRVAGIKGNMFDKMSSRRRVTASDTVAVEMASRHELEVAAEMGQTGRVRCYIDVTGKSGDEAKANARKVIEVAGTGRFVIAYLPGRQQRCVEASMPLGRGLPTMSVPAWV